MGINDPYDRSGQYANGDTGNPLSNYGGLANDNPDRRDVAIGTMMGEGGPRDNRAGYAGVLDTIENRISAVQGGANYGQKRGDSTLEGIAKARKGAEYNAWSPKQSNAYGQATRGQMGTPRQGNEQRMYDQARQVYDDYYQDGTFQGIAQGGTFYQNDALLSGKKAGSFQRNMQEKYGSVPIGIAGHVATGPGLNLGRSGAGFERVDPSITGSFGGSFAPSNFSDTMETPDVESFTGSTGINTLDAQPLSGNVGVNGIRGGTPGDDRLFDDAIPAITSPTMLGQPAQPQAINVNMPAAAVQQIQAKASPAVQQMAPMRAATPAQPRVAPRESFWTPGPVARAKGSNATGQETYRTQDGVIHDRQGAYGGGQAFGPNDPFGGLGFSTRGYADVVDAFDADLGITRSVYDRQGRLVDKGYWSGNNERGMEATGHDSSGNASVGDGSYSESSGRNDNNPQGII